MSASHFQPPPTGPTGPGRPPSRGGPGSTPGSAGDTDSALGRLIVGCVVVALVIGGCVAVVNKALNSPTTRQDLCSAYADFAQEWFDYSPSSGYFDSGAFDVMEDLAGVAQRYPDNPAVKSDGDRLEELADGDGDFIVSVSIGSAESASRNIAGECR
ncbi:MAG: hypothetical protein ACFCVK_14695 [Acidimicrobiales bacterium]